MSFRLVDLKKSVRRTKDGYQVTPARLEGRPAKFKVEFLLQQFEGHVGCPRRLLDPASLLDFFGDARLGRGLLATLTQWYRMRARTFAEVLPDCGTQLMARGVAGPVDLRAWLYAAVNRGGRGYLDPAAEMTFWAAQSRDLALRGERLRELALLDRPEQAVLVRTGPSPSTADVMAAYNARAHTTLLRNAREIVLRCTASPSAIEQAVKSWAEPLGVEWGVEGDTLRLFGRADALGCWTRHGRRVERVALELLALPDIQVRQVSGELTMGEREVRFCWPKELLTVVSAGPSSMNGSAEQIDALADTLRRARDRAGERRVSIRRASHTVAVAGGVFVPHVELRVGDVGLYLRLAAPDAAADTLRAFSGKTPVALISGANDPLTVCLPHRPPMEWGATDLLSRLSVYVDGLPLVAPSATGTGEQRSLRPAA